jgi:3-oxoacyl-[acyl-carrier protein] reductase
MGMQSLGETRTALVTGGSRGLGRAMCVGLAEMGCNVAVNYMSNETAAAEAVAACEAAGGQAVAIQGDVSNSDDVDALVAATRDAFGPIDILVNNAGIAPIQPVFEATIETWHQVMAVNLTSAFMVTEAVIKEMAERKWGRLIFMSSIAARVGGIFGGAYATSKAGTDGLMHHYAANLRDYGVTSNAISAALIETDIFDGVKLPPVDKMPLGRMGHPDEIGMVAQMMAANGFLTGQTIQVNAGRYMT